MRRRSEQNTFFARHSGDGFQMDAVQTFHAHHLRPIAALVCTDEQAARFAELGFQGDQFIAGYGYARNGAVDEAVIQHFDSLAGIAGASQALVLHGHIHAAGIGRDQTRWH